MSSFRELLVAVLALFVLTTIAQAQGAPADAGPWKVKTPLGLPDVMATAPADNPLTEAKVALGKNLFWDKRLSVTGVQACQTCHSPEMGWSDTRWVSKKASGKDAARHTPSLYNVAYHKVFFWDGRATSLEAAVKEEWEDSLGSKGRTDAIAQKLGAIAGYKTLFDAAFGPGAATGDKVVKALASFVRTVLSGNSPYDCFEAGQASAVSEAVKRGGELFRGKGRCGECHRGQLYTDDKFHMIAIGWGGVNKGDVGRGAIDKDPKMEGAMRTPTVRNAVSHPPFMHDGGYGSFDQILKWLEVPYGAKNLAPEIQGGIHLTADEKKDIIEFLKSLESLDAPEISSRPRLP